MADAVITTILEFLTSIASEELSRLVGVNEEVRNLQNNLQAIRAVLEDAESRQVREESVRDWLDTVKDVSYDINDVLDERQTAIQKSRVKKASKDEKVCSFSPSFCFSPSKVVQRHGIAIKIKNLNKRLDDIARQIGMFRFSSTKGPEGIERPITTSGINLSEIYGRDHDKIELMNSLFSESSQGPPLPIVSIVGMGGIGKTTLARIAFNDEKVNTHFDKKIWVCLSDPFDEIRIAKAILESLGGEAQKLIELEKLLKEIHESIKGKKFLLILDDVWTEKPYKWEQLLQSLSGCSQGSRIVVTTRKESTAKMMRTTITIPLGKLPDEESWSIFSQVAFFGRSSEECEILKDIGKKIVDKCNGLPLAIKTLGTLLSLKTQIEQWQNVLNSELWKLEDIEENLFPPILLSYYDLSPKLRKCFSYCAIFPKDYKIMKDRLIQLWMAQGYIKVEGNKNMELIGEEYFDNLAKRSFFQDFERSECDGGIISCKMHDIVHDFAQFLTKNECSTIEVVANAQVDLSYEKVRHLMVVGRDIPSPIHRCKKLLSLVLDSGTWLLVCKESDVAKLFKQLTCLRTLDLRSYLKEKLPRGIKNLIHLRHLNLRGAWIRELPEGVCDLYNLQTLDVSGCKSLRKLPHGIRKLVNLRQLYNHETDRLSYMPKGIESLTCLQTLSKFIISGGGHGNKACTSLECLRNLNHSQVILALHGLGNVRDIGAAKAVELYRQKRLSDLTLSFSDEEVKKEEGKEMVKKENEVVLEAFQPPPNLVKLRIEKYEGKTMTPSWMASLTNLRELSLRKCINWERLPSLGQLSSLESLSIKLMESVKRVDSEFLGIGNDARLSSSSDESLEIENVATSSSSTIFFPNLKTLEFHSLREWEEWWNYEIRRGRDKYITIMPCLRSMNIRHCRKFKAFPDYILQTPVEEFEIINCSSLSLNNILTSSSTIFANLKKLWLHSCINYECLPPLGKLSSLESLRIEFIKTVKKVDVEFLGIENEAVSSSSSSIVVFPKLKALEFWRMGEWEEWCNYEIKSKDQDIKIMPRLQFLTIHGCHKLKALPNYILTTSVEECVIQSCSNLSLNNIGKFSGTIFPNLRKLTLESIHCDCLPPLGKLSSLESLGIGSIDRVERVGNEFLGIESGDTSAIVFPKLKTLQFSDLKNWKNWDIITKGDEDVTIMPCLHSLSISDCDKLRALPELILQRSTLEELSIRDCSILGKLFKKEKGEDWPKVSHIPNIQIVIQLQ